MIYKSDLRRKGDLLTFDGAKDFTLPVGANNYVLTADSSQTAGLSWKPAGGSSVSGPISSTLNAIARYTDTSGKVIKNSGVTITDSNILSVPNSVITNTVRSTDNVPLDISSGTTGRPYVRSVRNYRKYTSIQAFCCEWCEFKYPGFKFQCIDNVADLNTSYIKRKTTHGYH